MAARIRKIRHDENTRLKIQAAEIINRLTKHIMGDGSLLNTSQVNAALGLLKKTLPDLASVENKNETIVQYVARLPEPVAAVAEWERRFIEARPVN